MWLIAVWVGLSALAVGIAIWLVKIDDYGPPHPSDRWHPSSGQPMPPKLICAQCDDEGRHYATRATPEGRAEMGHHLDRHLQAYLAESDPVAEAERALRGES